MYEKFTLNLLNEQKISIFMGFLRREKQITGTICKECGMEFSETERMLRHMIKAHTKSGKGPSCNC